MFTVDLLFASELRLFLPPRQRAAPLARRVLSEKTTIKDVIESCGVPHTEVDLIMRRDARGPTPVDLAWQVAAPAEVEVYACPLPALVWPEVRRLQPRTCARFVADGHLGKLARNLRLLGLDTAYERDADDRRLLEIMAAESRALLTRDRPLLMHSVVAVGYCPRCTEAEAQTREVLRRFEVTAFAPFTRCVSCNAVVASVAKSDVREQLAREPLTLRYYDEFQRCPGCGKVFWAGSHAARLEERVRRLLGHAETRG